MASDPKPEKGAPLTQRESEVLWHILRGRTSKEIARALNIAPRTVEFHRQNLYAKKGVRTALRLVADTLAERAA